MASNEDDLKIREFSNNFYWNNGNNGLNAIDNKQFNPDKFRDFINRYDYVFTTNYDTILDDFFQTEVFHLHGSFLMDKYAQPHIPKRNSKDSLIIWGIDDGEKNKYIQQAHQSHKFDGGIKFNSGVRYNNESMLDPYYNRLSKDDIAEIDIFCYSGENDGHINQKIMNNQNIKTINFYCSKKDIESSEFKQNTVRKFGKEKKINLIFWDNIWKNFMEGLNNG